MDPDVDSALTGRQDFTLHFEGLLPLSRCQGPRQRASYALKGAREATCLGRI